MPNDSRPAFLFRLKNSGPPVARGEKHLPTTSRRARSVCHGGEIRSQLKRANRGKKDEKGEHLEAEVSAWCLSGAQTLHGSLTRRNDGKKVKKKGKAHENR